MSFDSEDPDISRIFAQKTDRRFQRDFGRFMHHHQQQMTQHNNGGERQGRQSQSSGSATGNKSDQMSVKLIEANETIELLRRQLEARNDEIERLKRAEVVANERTAELQKESDQWKAEADRARRISSGQVVSQRRREEAHDKTNEKLLLDDYRTALSKYRTWMQFAERQLQTMKMLLEEHGGWTETNRYKIYFSYKEIEPKMVNHENVAELASGSILSYIAAIEDVESISATQPHPKFHSVPTQTDDVSMSMLEMQPVPSAASHQSQPSQQSLNSAFTTAIERQQQQETSGLTAQELRLIDYERTIERLEIDCAQQRERIIILSERAKHVELLEEQKADLQLQADILRQHNDQLICNHEQLKSIFGGGAISRNGLEELVRNASQLKEKNKELELKIRNSDTQKEALVAVELTRIAHKNKELECKNRNLEAQREALTTAESRRIAQLFKRKYEVEMSELRSKLHKYEPPHASDTTRILRFAASNPLDEAHDELVIREVAAAAAAASSSNSGPNPLKRRKLDNSDEEEGGGDKKKALLDVKEVDEELDLNVDELEPSRLHELRVQLSVLKKQLEQTEKNNADFMREYREVITLLSGYDVRLGEEGFCEVENVHSKECVFLFQKHNLHPPTVDLLDNDSARRWKDIIENYLMRYNSVPAFLSAVTISLVESPEEGISSSQQSQQSVSSESKPL